MRNHYLKRASKFTGALCVVLMALSLVACGGGGGGGSSSSGGSSSGSSNATLTGSVSGTTIIAVDENDNEVARHTTTTDKSFSLSLPTGKSYRFYFIENEGTSNVKICPMYQGAVNVFRLDTAQVINLGFVDTSTGIAIPTNNPFNIGLIDGGTNTATPAKLSLIGTWFLAGDDIQGKHTWDGTIAIDSSGNVTSGTLNSSAGKTYSIVSGNLSIDATEKVTGSLKDSNNVTTQFTMQMEAQKGIIAGEGNATTGNEDGTFIFVKTSSNFTTSNLQGTWFLAGNDIQGNHTWDGTIAIDSSGNVTSGTLNSSASKTYSIVSGSFSIDATGRVTGSLKDSDNVTTQFTMQMETQKGIIAGEGNATTGNEDGTFIFVKKW